MGVIIAIVKQPLVLGHRGARATRQIPENTLASFELCLKHGCDGFEFDVRRSADGRAVVCHDPVVRGMEIAKTRAAELGLPSLEEVLRVFAGRAFLDIELKVAGVEPETVALLQEHAPPSGYVVSSFLPERLVAVREMDAKVPLGFIYDKIENERAKATSAPARVEWMIPRVDLVNQELVQRVHAAGQKIAVWTVNRADEMKQMAEWGLDAIISDETERLVGELGAP